MNWKQLTLIAATILFTIALFVFGKTKTDKVDNQLMATQKPTTITVDFNSIVQNNKTKLSSTQIEQVTLLETQLLNTTNQTKKIQLLTELQNSWSDIHPVNAYYSLEIAELVQDENSWNKAANNLFHAAQNSHDTIVVPLLFEKAIYAFEKSIEINPTHQDNKINLATCYVEGSGNIMQGVTILLEVVKTNPENIKALMLLGKLAMISGQYDKAIVRFEKIIMLKNDHVEARLFLAEAYQSIGKKSQAIDVLESTKPFVSNPEFIRDIDKFIKQLKNS